MFHSEIVNHSSFLNWSLDAYNYLNNFLISDNNVNVFETKNAGHNNITIGYEEYINPITVTL